MRLPSALVFLALPLALLGCPAMHQSPPVRAQETASEMNLNARFGRMEIAAENVAPKAREAFLERRRAWGSKIRVADYELAGMKMKADADAEIFVKIAWFRVNEGDLRVTTVRQNWHDFKGDWKLVDEARMDGDEGLLGEAVTPTAAPAARRTQFPTIRLGTGASEPSAQATPATATPAAPAPADEPPAMSSPEPQ